jgi:hypothetical protein
LIDVDGCRDTGRRVSAIGGSENQLSGDGPESVGISGSGESEDELIVRVLDIKAVDTLIGNTVGE